MDYYLVLNSQILEFDSKSTNWPYELDQAGETHLQVDPVKSGIKKERNKRVNGINTGYTHAAWIPCNRSGI